MKCSWLRLEIIALAWLLALPHARAAEVLRVGVDGSYPPLSYQTAEGRMEGFDIDVAFALCAEMRQRCELIPGPFSKIIDQLRAGAIDMAVASMSVTNERRKLVDFSIPYYRAPNRFIGRSELAASISKDSPPSGLVIGMRQGTTFERYGRAVLDGGNKVIGYPLQEELYLDLAMNRIDLALGNELTVRVGFLETQLGDGFDAVGPFLSDSRYFGDGEAVALRKGNPTLKNAVNEAIERLVADGGLDDIWSRYFSNVPRVSSADD